MKTKSMQLVSMDDLNLISNQLEKIYLKLSSMYHIDEVLTNPDVEKILKVSQRTLQSWRDSGILKHSKVEGKIYYRLKDIQELINKNASK